MIDLVYFYYLAIKKNAKSFVYLQSYMIALSLISRLDQMFQ